MPGIGEARVKVYKIVMLLVDHDELGPKGIKSLFEDEQYPNHIIGPDVMSIEERDIGEWHDKHPLNFHSKMRAEYERLFPEPRAPGRLGGDE